ncbi:MAG: hypothetical protein R3E10_04955 [Gemmatimonadota bacterium]
MKPRLGEARRTGSRLVWTLILGLFLGGLLTQLCELFLPESAARTFLTVSAVASLGPFSIDLVAVAFTIGPLQLSLNVLTLIGIGGVWLIARSLI